MRARAYNPENIELLCIPCHIKTHQEMHSHRKEKVAENKARARRRFLEANDPNWQMPGDGSVAAAESPARELSPGIAGEAESETEHALDSLDFRPFGYEW